MSVLKNVNYLLELDRIPCAQPDAWIIIKTAFASAPPALLTLFQPGCTEIIKTRLGLSPWHLKGISGMIKKAARPESLGGRKWLYKIGYFSAEKYLYWWMVADVTTEFLTTWQSMVYQEQQCQLPGAGTAHGIYAPFVYLEGFPSHAAWIPESSVPGLQYGGGKLTVMPGYEATVAYQLKFQGFPDPSAISNVITYWQEEGDDIKHDTAITFDPQAKNGNTTGGSWYHNRPGFANPTVYSIGVENTGSNPMQLYSGQFNISLFGRRQGNTTFGCKLKPVEWPFPNILG